MLSINKESESNYLISKKLTDNITIKSLRRLFRSIGEEKTYNSSGLDVNIFISNVLNSGTLNIEKFNEYLFDELFYGQQKSTYIYKIYNSEMDLLSETEIVNILKQKYNIDKVNFNVLSIHKFDNKDKPLAAFKLEKKDGKITKIRFIFGEKIKYYRKKQEFEGYSYIPVEINLEMGLLITKVSPKTQVDDDYKPEHLANKYSKSVIENFKLEIECFDEEGKEILYKISNYLYNKLYDKMVTKKPEEIDEVINYVEDKLKTTLKIDKLETKQKFNNIFKINDNITNLVEHILISDIVYSQKIDNENFGLEGYVTYLRFNDTKNVNARLRGEGCKDTVFDSETFMGLRSAIENTKSLKEINVLWFCNGNNFRVKYDASDSNCLHLHYYSNLNEGDFYYGLKKYRDFE